MRKFSDDTKDSLANFFHSEMFHLIAEVLEDILTHQQKTVITLDLQQPNGYQRVVEEKARAEGMQRMINDFMAMRNRFKANK